MLVDCMNTSFQRQADREDELVSTCKSWTNADSYLIAAYRHSCTKGPGRRRKGPVRRREGTGEGETSGQGKGQGKGAARPLHIRCKFNTLVGQVLLGTFCLFSAGIPKLMIIHFNYL